VRPLEDHSLTTKLVNDWLARLADDTDYVDDPNERTRLRDARTASLQRLPR
jgi:hypothetical protein